MQSKESNIKLLLLGRAVSLFGSTIYLIVLPLYILNTTKNLKTTGIFFAAVNFPTIIVSIFIGTIIEKFNKKNIILICDFLTSMLYFVLFLYLKNFNSLSFLFLISLLINIVSKFFEIASKVLFSEINSPETLEKYNGLQSFMENTIIIVGPVIGTYLFVTFDFNLILIIVSLGYFLSFLQELFIKYEKNLNLSIEKTNFLEDFKEGISYIGSNKIILNFFILVMFLNFFIANNDEIINPGILIRKYEISEKLFGFSATSYGAGSVFAGIFIYYNNKFKFLKKLKLLFILNSFLMCLLGLLSIILFKYNHYIYFTIFIFFQFLIGMITTFVNVPLISSFQKNVEIEYQSRFFSILSFFSGGLIPLGILYAGYLSSYIGADITYIINNLAIIAIVCLVFKNIERDC
ncbi:MULTISPECIES: MFS transporter [Fusobacterium]|uniref:MFS transporter n=2 Tax=Fusobacterium TaxID=848 RepID=A0A323TXV3_FUSNU|nr:MULTISPECIES: MFS transporter [Fusobacterium]PCR85271.1 MFS transporter [Fusobacterium nucleatum]PHI17564.1 MFS transporter [Fusobacterium polymorphum]PZA05412.1 MFS transporter [Fusobacterium nucleatum]QJX50344.1 MFS transporter [Fusobacterium nucleatum]QYR58713.1 MFS transporter [Fusobacterium polymorphum]